MPVNHQFPLASSMDLLSSKSSLTEHRTDAYQDVSIHSTLPRKKKGPPPIRSCDDFSHMGTLPHSKSPRQNSPLTQDGVQESPRQDRQGETFTFRGQECRREQQRQVTSGLLKMSTDARLHDVESEPTSWLTVDCISFTNLNCTE
ncbi:Breast cancer anti-estrogen resistance protein 3 [Saguinus oedipus]|uniref:Breast cancer anti-estrogen resistance protein 3 n=1 Tax=Saguinus oedipus TaxID=9490 RepID=A0ABQ9VCB9_SAGOE|nr:Breast cancer anti-estrogen resistance protein 3 [Saguinus oedipus]